ncbi:hypothetical protein [Tenacibaculum sp. 190524A05c]|uniref:Trimeric autotransporter adhesin n=1 Tax=Tenacibaculum platacis TaxID=3137852 RepID=A0ABM9P2S9_9FLAO
MKKIIIAIAIVSSIFSVKAQDENIKIGLSSPSLGIKMNMNFPGYTGGWARGFSVANESSENFISFGGYGSSQNGVASLNYGYIGKAYNDTYMVFSPNGYVGIGSTAPQGKFEVYSKDENKEIYFRAQHDGRNQNSDSPRLNFVGYAQTAGFGIQAMNSGGYGKKDLVFYGHKASDYTSYYEAARLTYDGKLAIGTSVPKEKLHVKGNFYADMGEGFRILGDINYFGQYKDGIVFQMEDTNGTNGNTDGGFVFRGHTPTDGLSKEWMVIKTGGRVGIGTSSPSQILDIESGNNDGSNPPVLRLTSKDINAVNNQLLGEIQFYSKDADGPHVSAYIKNLAAETYGRQGQLSFGTTAGNSSNAIERMRINDIGNVGIGTTSPSAKLHVAGTFISAGNMSNTFGSGSTLTLFGGSTKGNRLIAGADDDGAYIRSTWASGGTDAISFRNSSGAKTMIIDANNNVGIGVTDTKGYNLAVAGSNGIIAEKVTVKLQSTWPDYVFTNDYKLPTLEEVEQQISNNGHLSNIPSAAEVKKNGIELGEMNKKLLEKIEELTLYTIQQDKEIKALKKQDSKLEKLEKENQELKDRLSKIEEMLSKK